MPESECKTNKHNKDMQTIRINTRTNASGNVTTFSINGTCIAHVGKDLYNVGRYAGRVNHAGGAVLLAAAIELTAGSNNK